MSGSVTRQAGLSTEGAVMDYHPQFRSIGAVDIDVSDAAFEHIDAVATERVVLDDNLPGFGLFEVPEGTLAEIKSAMVVYGEAQRRGRFTIRRTQHETLRDEDGVYVFAVCTPTRTRDLIAAKVVAPEVVDLLDWSWREAEGIEVAQIAWSKLFEPEEVEKR